MTTGNTTYTSLRDRTVLAAALALIGLAGAARADPDLVDLKIVDRDTRQELRTWRHHGRLFVAGEPGARYVLRVANHTDGRVLLVLSVDGVNVVTGETASYDQRGYVIGPYGSYDVTGWRKSNTEVAAFAFAPLPQSYAARTGRPDDVGVIGMAVFTERAPPPMPFLAPTLQPDWKETLSPLSPGAAGAGSSTSPAPSPTPGSPGAPVPFALPAPPPLYVRPPSPSVPAPAPPPPPPASAIAGLPNSANDETLSRRADEKLGTAHGAREWSFVGNTAFDRATPYPRSVQKIEYDTYANLVASGVIPRSTNPEHRPRPFPSTNGGSGFVPDPPKEP